MIGRRVLSLSPRHSRSLSLLDNVKKILGRTPAPPSPLPSDTTARSGSVDEAAVPTEDTTYEKVGRQQRSKVIGFDLSTPARLTGTELTNALALAFTQALGKKSAVPEAKKLKLARSVMEKTGRRIPDSILNAAKEKQDIVNYFDKEDARGSKRINVLRFDQDSLPENVRIGT